MLPFIKKFGVRSIRVI